MSTDLPEMDDAISFTVDNGVQAGPFTMRSIVDSVKAGHRARSTLVWWAGQADWVRFESVPGLLALVDEPEPTGSDVTEPTPIGSEVTGAPPAGSEGTEATPLQSVSSRIDALRPVAEGIPVGGSMPDSAPAADDELDRVFAGLLQQSAQQERRGWTERLDLELRRALTGATLQTAHVLVDLRTTGTATTMLFEEPDGSRITVGVQHLPPSSTASVSIGWGHRVADVSAAPQPVADAAAEIETYVASGYAYALVDMIWAYEDFLAPSQLVDVSRLREAVESTVHVLRTEWHQRFVEAESGRA